MEANQNKTRLTTSSTSSSSSNTSVVEANVKLYLEENASEEQYISALNFVLLEISRGKISFENLVLLLGPQLIDAENNQARGRATSLLAEILDRKTDLVWRSLTTA